MEKYTTIKNLDDAEPEEVLKKIRAFGFIKTYFNGKIVKVTDVVVKDKKVKIRRINYLPVWLYKLFELLRRRHEN